MLKLVGIAIGLAVLVQGALAETPERVLPEAAMSIGIGRSETLRFQSAFDQINVSSQGIVQATAQSDHVMTLLGQAPGVAIVTVRDGARELYSVAVEVTTEPGRIVKLYNGKSPDYVGYYCTDAACGRADKELNGSREAQRSEQTIIHREGNRVRD